MKPKLYPLCIRNWCRDWFWVPRTLEGIHLHVPKVMYVNQCRFHEDLSYKLSFFRSQYSIACASITEKSHKITVYSQPDDTVILTILLETGNDKPTPI